MSEIEAKRKELTEEELREYVRTEFVQSGFIEVQQWRNFIDYLQILIKQERQKGVEMARKEFLELLNKLYENYVKDLEEGNEVKFAMMFMELKQSLEEKK